RGASYRRADAPQRSAASRLDEVIVVRVRRVCSAHDLTTHVIFLAPPALRIGDRPAERAWRIDRITWDWRTASRRPCCRNGPHALAFPSCIVTRRNQAVTHRG